MRVLRLLPPFAGALREKSRTRASFNKIPTNCISVENLINVLYKKNTILAMFSFSMCQETVRRETTEGSSIEFIGYRIPPHEQNGCTVLFTRHQSTKVCRAFSIFWLVIEIFTSKVGVAKNMRDVLRKWTPRGKGVKYQNFPTHFGLSLSLECSGEISQQSIKSTYPINSLKVDVFRQKSNARF